MQAKTALRQWMEMGVEVAWCGEKRTPPSALTIRPGDEDRFSYTTSESPAITVTTTHSIVTGTVSSHFNKNSWGCGRKGGGGRTDKGNRGKGGRVGWGRQGGWGGGIYTKMSTEFIFSKSSHPTVQPVSYKPSPPPPPKKKKAKKHSKPSASA